MLRTSADSETGTVGRGVSGVKEKGDEGEKAKKESTPKEPELTPEEKRVRKEVSQYLQIG